jgi:hypothetical protein
MQRTFLGLTMADVVRLAYQPFLQEKLKDWKKVVEKFPTSS